MQNNQDAAALNAAGVSPPSPEAGDLAQVEAGTDAPPIGNQGILPPSGIDLDDLEGARKDQATYLVALALASGARFFYTSSGEPFAVVPNGAGRRVVLLDDPAAAEWLTHLYYDRYGRVPGRGRVRGAVELLAGLVKRRGTECALHLRVAPRASGGFVLDLGGKDLAAVVVDAHGWRIEADCGTCFSRPMTSRALPNPRSGGDLQLLWQLLPLPDDDRLLVLAWLIAALLGEAPFPILLLTGEQGSGKSVTARMLKGLIDPAELDLRAEPKNIQDLVVGARHAHVLALDNLSSISVALSDGLCRMSTGGGFATRTLFTTADETIISVARPVLVTGIDELFTRADLLDRTLLITLPPIAPGVRQPEAELRRRFLEQHGLLLGALLDVASRAVAALPGIELTAAPRMADFARLGVAVERAVGLPDGTFLAAYESNRLAAHAVALESAPVAAGVEKLLAENGGNWQGTASELLELLALYVPERARRAIPVMPKNLSDILRRLTPNLRAVGIEVEFKRLGDQMRTRQIRIEKRS